MEGAGSYLIIMAPFHVYDLDYIDPIKDNFPPKDYKKEEDPRIFVSSKTKRGPLSDDWLDAYKDGSNTAPVMCAYKLIKVEFKYWGMQVRISSIRSAQIFLSATDSIK